MAGNDTLITTADSVVLDLNGTNDIIANTDGATAFVIGNGNVGDDSIENFGKNDSIINYKKIYDGNNDGIVSFGPNGILDIDRTSSKNAGADQITLIGLESKALRYLGTKDGTAYAYADASVRLAGFTEGYVSNDTISASTGAKKIFYDTALGLNLGADTITGFSSDDLLVTTRALYDSDNNGIVTFGSNHVLDLSGETGAAATDPTLNPGGQIDFVSPDIQALNYLGSHTVDGVDYFYYGLDGASLPA